MRTISAPHAAFPVAVAAALLLGTRSAAQCQYSVVQWSPWVCDWDGNRIYTGTGLNDLGAWCGYRSACFPEESQVLTWLPVYCPPGGIPQVLPMPPNAVENGAQAVGVTAAGDVVGFSYQGTSGSVLRGCVWWHDGSFTEIEPAPGGTNSRPWAVNASGLVVGGSAGDPYRWLNGVMETMNPAPFTNGTAYGVSSSGVVVGSAGNPNVNARAFRWYGDSIDWLEPVPGYPISVARGANSSGHVVGYSKIDSPLVQWPTLWTASEPIALPMPAGYTTGAAGGINDAGVIFGSASGPGVPSAQLIWLDGEVYKLSDLLAPGSATLGNVVDINASGQLLSGGGPKLGTPIGSSIADLTGDCSVDGDDLGVLLASWGSPDFDPRSDLNGDGVVDGFDLGTLLGEWTPIK